MERLPDWAYSETELMEYYVKVASDVYTVGSVWLLSIHSSRDTEKVMIVHGSRELVEVLDKIWDRVGLRLSVVKERQDVRYIDYIGMINMLPGKYETKFPDMPMADRVYESTEWMKELI